MPEWLTGLAVGVAITLLTQYAQLYFGRIQFRYEKLIDRYSQFVAVASDELERVKSLRAGINMDMRGGDYTDLFEKDERRHPIRREFAKLSFQIQLLETDKTLADKVKDLSKAQPYQPFLVPPKVGEGKYNERFERFENQIVEFEKELNRLIEAILQKHCNQGMVQQ